MVAVVSEDEIAVFGHLGAGIGLVIFCDVGLIQCEGIVVGIGDIDLATLYLYPFTGQSDHPFDEILARVLRGLKYDHIASLRVAKPVVRLSDEQTLPGVKVGLHGRALHLTALQCELHQQEDRQRYENGE